MKARDPQFLIPATVDAINSAMAPRLLRSALRKARILHEAQQSQPPAGLQDLITNFIPNNVMLFLNENKCMVFGSNQLPQNPSDPVNIRQFSMVYRPGEDRYELKVGVHAGGHPFQADSVAANFWLEALPLADLGKVKFGLKNVTQVSFTHIPPIKLSGNHVMLTTQFTGCTFCMQQAGGSVYCAHLTPAGVPGEAPNTNGTDLSARVVATGRFRNLPGGVPPSPLVVYGRNNGTPPHGGGYDLGVGPVDGKITWMTIMGFPHAGSYRIYAQTIRNREIRTVQQVFP
jgi:hypothetical protein